MIRAEIKQIVLADEPEFDPDNPANFSADLHLYVGPVGEGIQEMFSLTVCSPGWLAKRYLTTENDILMGLHFLFIADYNLPRIQDWIRAYIRNYGVGETWEEVASKINQLAR